MKKSFNSRKIVIGLGALCLLFSPVGFSKGQHITHLYQSDFDEGTYIIEESGVYRLAEDISFNPHPPGTLGEDGVMLDAYIGALPFPSQLGNPDEGKYDPAAFGLGFFAAVVIEAENVILDLNGYTLEQSEDHALLQRFFSVIELTDQPFIGGQGPSDFGDEIKSAKNVWIVNGTIGRSSHHGIHGNGNKNIRIINVDFEDFEVGAVALNGVKNLVIIGSTAKNRENVPVIGTYSNARFIAPYVNWLVDTGSTTTLNVQGIDLTVVEIQDALRESINNVYHDVISEGLGFIDETEHPNEYALYHNKHGVIDGNSYGYLVNPLGAAVGGFPSQPDIPAKNIFFKDVHVLSQRAFINEVVALKQNGKPAIDPIGAVFMVKNVHPVTGKPVTTSSLDDSIAVYTGNVLANAQALVAKAALAGEFISSHLDTSRLNITQEVIDWIESDDPLSILVTGPNDYLCNGDTMFHVNKGVVGFKMDGAKNIVLKYTSAENLENLGDVGSALGGNYEKSHPDATLPGYGGAKVRGYTFCGSKNVWVQHSRAIDLRSFAGTVVGFDVFTDSENVNIRNSSVYNIEAGLSFVANGGPNEEPDAIGVHVGEDAHNISLRGIRVRNLTAFDDEQAILDESQDTKIWPRVISRHSNSPRSGGKPRIIN